MNPFDDDYDDDNDDDDNDDDDEIFHDAQQEVSRQRVADLNFDKPFDDVENPALRFDRPPPTTGMFPSPLESAMMDDNKSPAKNTGYSTFAQYHNAKFLENDDDGHHSEDLNDEEITEGSALLRTPSKNKAASPARSQSSGRQGIPKEINTGPSPPRIRNPKRRSLQNAKKNMVLKEVATGKNEFTMDYKYILLEDLGTASSWLILLLPYMAFFLALLLDSSKSLKTATVGPLPANQSCLSNIIAKEPLDPAPMSPCSTSFSDRLIDQGDYDVIAGAFNKTTTLKVYSGLAFDSGVVRRIPVLSTYFYGDADFDRLSTETVAMVAQGLVEASIVVLQEQTIDEEDWVILFSSAPKTLAMACGQNQDYTWSCKTPRLVNVLFSMPDAAVYAAGDLRVHIFFSLKPPKSAPTFFREDPAWVYTKSKADSEYLLTVEVDGNQQSSLEALVKASSYTFEHMSDFAMKLDTGVRTIMFLITLWFALFWGYSMGIHKACLNACRRGKQKAHIHWWESPWILFPERWYIILLLVALLMVQDPLLAMVAFQPTLGASTRNHVAADATIGIGVQGILFVYLCLFDGLPLHTASVTTKRAKHQRQILQLRRAAKYVAKPSHPSSPTEEYISDYVNDYFDRYGDIDGTASKALLRLKNDPLSDEWADFLLFKLFLLLVGTASVFGTAYCRFPPINEDIAAQSNSVMHQYKLAYMVCILIQFLTLITWMILIIGAAIGAGHKLRREPFLGTRPVQLAYRILLAHLTLGLTVLTASVALAFSRIGRKWSSWDPMHRTQAGTISENSHTELLLEVLSQVAKQFPYSGTAASVGSGKIIFATVSVLITAFIFLPSHLLEDDYEEEYVETWGTTFTILNDKLHEKRRLRRDKRLVVTLARYSKTWRVFPLPIKQSTVMKGMLHDDVFQLYSDMHTGPSTKGRGVVSVGPYTPVFCLETACWLIEASWQAYYAPSGIANFDTSIPPMNLEGLGLQLEGAIYDQATDALVYVATNAVDQVDGEADTIIVVTFKGSTSSTNLQTDLKSRQVPLLDQLAGIGIGAPFSIYRDRVEVQDQDGWIWATPEPHLQEALQCVTSWTGTKPSRKPSRKPRNEDTSSTSHGARKILQSTPVARSTFPLVHEGFQEVYTCIRRKLMDILLPVLHRQFEKVLKSGESVGKREPLALPKIYCTGHSLGGSLSQLLAIDLANNCELVLPTGLRLQPPIAVYTFGQPRVGNKAFSSLYKQRCPHSFRVVNEGDAITSMPNYLFCGGTYKHSGLEVLLDEGQTGNILVGPTVVETMFRFSKVRTSVMAHTMQRYRDCLECAFDEAELVEYYRGHNVVLKRGTSNGTEEIVATASDLPEWMTHKARYYL